MDYSFYFLTRKPNDAAEMCAVYLRKINDNMFETGIRVLNGCERPYLAVCERTPVVTDAYWFYEHNKDRALQAGYTHVLNDVNSIINTTVNGGF